MSWCLCRQYDEYIANVEIRTEFVDNKTNHQRVIYKFTPYTFTGVTKACTDAFRLPGKAARMAGCLQDVRALPSISVFYPRVCCNDDDPPLCAGIDDIQIKGASLMPPKVQEQIIMSCMPENVYKVAVCLACCCRPL